MSKSPPSSNRKCFGLLNAYKLMTKWYSAFVSSTERELQEERTWVSFGSWMNRAHNIGWCARAAFVRRTNKPNARRLHQPAIILPHWIPQSIVWPELMSRVVHDLTKNIIIPRKRDWKKDCQNGKDAGAGAGARCAQLLTWYYWTYRFCFFLWLSLFPQTRQNKTKRKENKHWNPSSLT